MKRHLVFQLAARECVHRRWSRFHVMTRKHFYHVGAKEENRGAMVEALVMNILPVRVSGEQTRLVQPALF